MTFDLFHRIHLVQLCLGLEIKGFKENIIQNKSINNIMNLLQPHQ